LKELERPKVSDRMISISLNKGFFDRKDLIYLLVFSA
jgi:hypothetical protein